MNITGNTILITGAGTGMGLEAARQFSRRGNSVIMVARNQERLRSAASGLANASVFACDITDEAQVQRLVSYLRTRHPELNMVLLNAGVTNSYELFGDEDPYPHALQEMTTNYLSTVRLTHALEPLLGRHAEAAFIITTSGVAFAPDILNPTYSASKAAMHSLVQAQRLVLQRRSSPVQIFELMAPLVDSPFSAHVLSEHKMAPEDVIAVLLAGLQEGELELRVGPTEDLYQLMRTSPDQAIHAVNAITGG